MNLIKRKLDDSIRIETKNAIPAGRHHVAMTYDGSRMATGVRIYVDGQSQPLEIILDAINQDFATKQPLRIGGSGGFGPPFVGTIQRRSRVCPGARSRGRDYARDDSRTCIEIAAIPAAKRTPGEQRRMRQAFLALGADKAIRESWNAQEKARDDRDAFVDEHPDGHGHGGVCSRRRIRFYSSAALTTAPVRRCLGECPRCCLLCPLTLRKNRLGLAQWLVSESNPLTARVAVNRFWQMYFGTGIVKTVEDFGSQGEWPSHPELLDWLASEFVRSGWNVKQLQKTIVMSATYRQSSVVTPELASKDPENRLLSRAPRLRLPAEVVRDQALAASGLLVEKIGGPSVKPYQPAGLWSELGGADYERDHGANLYRRSLYTFWKRTAPPPFMANFDSAMRESCTVRESRTNTPLQALNVMNDVTFVEAARVYGSARDS